MGSYHSGEHCIPWPLDKEFGAPAPCVAPGDNTNCIIDGMRKIVKVFVANGYALKGGAVETMPATALHSSTHVHGAQGAHMVSINQPHPPFQAGIPDMTHIFYPRHSLELTMATYDLEHYFSGPAERRGNFRRRRGRWRGGGAGRGARRAQAVRPHRYCPPSTSSNAL